jgi:hypothetical protein
MGCFVLAYPFVRSSSYLMNSECNKTLRYLCRWCRCWWCCTECCCWWCFCWWWCCTECLVLLLVGSGRWNNVKKCCWCCFIDAAAIRTGFRLLARAHSCISRFLIRSEGQPGFLSNTKGNQVSDQTLTRGEPGSKVSSRKEVTAPNGPAWCGVF